MGGCVDTRAGGWRHGPRIAVATVAVLCTLPPAHMSAQVGHNPAHSPYHDIQRGSTVRVVGGYFSGSRGKIPVGPTDGPTGGLRYEVAASGVFTFAAGLAYAQTDAYYFDPLDTLAPRRGPVDNDVLFADVGLQASLTGGKSWHRFQPYVGVTLGLAIGSTIAADTSGYNFGTKLSYGPEGGLRWYPARRLSMELSYRLVLYKQQYPFSYIPTLVSTSRDLAETTKHPWVTLGVGWTF